MVKGRLAVISSLVGILILLIAACAPAATPTPTATPTPPPAVATATPTIATATPPPGVATPTPTPVAATPTLVAGMPVGYGYSPFGEWGMPLNMPPPVYGGIFKEASTQPFPHYDSHRTIMSPPLRPSAPVLDSLIRFSPYMDIDLIPLTYELDYLAPNLAEKWEVSSDGLLVTFYLKRGVKWTDGKPFTAKDVKYTYSVKLADPERSVWTATLAMIDRVEAVDDYTVKFYLKYPAIRLFLLSVAMSHLTIQPEHRKDVSYRTTDFIAVGTGAYKFKSYTPGIEAIYERNPDYHFKGRPYFDGLKFIFFPAGDSPWNALAAGQVDFYESYRTPEGPLTMVKRVAPEVKIRYNNKLYVNANMVFSFIKEGPWQDVRVRKALSMVLDRQALCIADWGGTAEKACFTRGGYFMSPPLGPGLPFEAYEKAWELNKPIAERVAAAKKLLAEAGYPNGFKVTLLTTGAASGSVLVVMDQWQRLLNLDIAQRIVPSAQSSELTLKGDFELASSATLPTIGAMEQLVNVAFVKGGQYNLAQYTHPLVEELYIKLLSERDKTKALEIYHKMERFLIDDIPIIYLWTGGWIIATWPYIKPYLPDHPMYHTNFNGRFTIVWFDKNDPTWTKRTK